MPTAVESQPGSHQEAQHGVVTREELLRQLQWRYATKKYDTTRKISAEDWAALEKAITLSPSSSGLQPWRFTVVDDPAVRVRLREASFGQPQITDASHMVVFAVRKDFGPADVERHLRRTAEVRGVPRESLAGYEQMMLGSLRGKSQEQITAWAARQVYIALGVFVTSAAMLGIDASPMEGFEPAKYDEILKLSEQGYTALAVGAAGYRSAEDAYAKAPKVRYKHEEVVKHV